MIIKPTRSLLLSCFLGLSTLAPSEEGETLIPRFTLSACAVGMQHVADLFWLDLTIRPDGTETRTFQPLPIALGNRGAKVRIPVRPPLKLFRLAESKENEQHYEPVLSLPDRDPEDQIFLIFFRKENGETSFNLLDDSPKAHPPGTVRVVNQTPGRCAVSLGGNPVVVPPGQNKLLGAPPGGADARFPFQFAATITGGLTYAPPVKRLRLRSAEHRLLILFSYFPEFETTEKGETLLTGYQPRAYRMYDQIPVESPDDSLGQ